MSYGVETTLTPQPPDNTPELLDWLQQAIAPVDRLDIHPRIHALRQLRQAAQSPSAACQILHELLTLIQTEPQPQVVQEALLTLAHLKVYSAMPLLVDIAMGANIAALEPAMAESVSPDVIIRLRAIAIRQLGLMGHQDAIVPLMGILGERQLNYRLRLEAAEALGRLGDANAVEPLINIARDERESSQYVKESAVKALGMLGDIRALDPLLDLFEAQRGVKRKVQFVLERVLEAVHQIARPRNERVLATLLKALEDPAPSIRLVAVESLGDLGGEEHLPLLEQCLFDDNMDVAHAALASLYQLGGTACVLRQMANDNLPNFLREEIDRFVLSTFSSDSTDGDAA